MSAVISSAQPLKLYRYSDVSTGMDQDLMSEANHLSGILRHFESRCTEYAVRVSYLADSLRDHARTAEGVDRWVRAVGLGFEQADRGHVVTLALQGRGVFSAQAAGVIARLNPLTSFTQRWSLWLQFKETDWALNMALWRIRYLIFRLQYAPWLDLVRMPWDLYEKYRPMFAGALIAGSIRVGHAYAGQIIINLPNFLTHFGVSLREIRTWAGLSSHLNHIKYTRLPTHMFWVSLAVSIPSLVSKWGSDIQDYAGGKYSGTELASAITVDTALTLAPVGTSYVGSLAGLKIGALIGTAIAPGVGTAIGGAVGAITGGILAGWATNEAIERTDIREKAIPWLDQHVFGPVAGAISSGVSAVSSWVDAAGQRFRQKMQDAVDAASQVTYDNSKLSDNFRINGTETSKSTELFVKGPGDNHTIHPNDVMQVGLSDCYLVAAMATIADQHPDLIQNAIQKNADGTYTVALYKKRGSILGFGGKYERLEMVVTPDFPKGEYYSKEAKQWIPARVDVGTGDDELWPRLIEKAYGQLISGSQDINRIYGKLDEGGFSSDALAAISGIESVSKSPNHYSLQELVDMKNNGYALALSSKPDFWKFTDDYYRNDTLVRKHVYWIDSIDIKNKTVTVRNPWGYDDSAKNRIIIPYADLDKNFRKITVNPLNEN